MTIEDKFALFYIKDGLLYPVILTEEQSTMLQLTAQGIVANNVKLLNQPIGKAIDKGNTTL